MTNYSPSSRLWEGVAFDPAISGAWAPPLVGNFTLIDSMVNGTSPIDLTGLTSYTLTTANGSPDQAREAIVNFINTPSGICTVTLPNVPRVGWVINNTAGGFGVILTAGPGSTVTLPPDAFLRLYVCDGQGNVTLPTIVAGASAVSGNSLTITGNGSVSGAMAVGSLTTTGVVNTGPLAASGSVSGSSLMTSGNVSGGSVTSNGPLSAGATTITGQLSASSAIISGALQAASVTSTGAISAASLSTSGPFSSGAISSSGAITSASTFAIAGGSWTLALGAAGTAVFASPAGNAAIRLDTTSTGAKVNINAASGGAVFTGLGVNIGNASAAYAAWQFNAATIGGIAPNAGGTAVLYNTTSDAKLKIDCGMLDLGQATKMLMKLRPRWFCWKSDPDADPEPGFFAQQVWRYFPWAVAPGIGRRGSKRFRPWQMDASKLVPLLVAALQDAHKRIEALERSR